MLKKYPGNLNVDGTRYEPEKKEASPLRKGLKSKMVTMLNRVKPGVTVADQPSSTKITQESQEDV